MIEKNENLNNNLNKCVEAVESQNMGGKKKKSKITFTSSKAAKSASQIDQ